jgi:hypothetical protein
LAITGIDYLATTELQLSHMWDFFLIDNPPDPGKDLPNFVDLGKAALTSVVNTTMLFKVTETSLPIHGLETETSRAGFKLYESRTYLQDFNVSILEDVLFSSFAYFQNWMDKIYDTEKAQWKVPPPPIKTGILVFYSSLSLASEIGGAKSSNLLELLPSVPSAVFTLENVKVKKIGDISLNRGGANPLILRVTLTADKLRPLSASTGANTLASLIGF